MLSWDCGPVKRRGVQTLWLTVDAVSVSFLSLCSAVAIAQPGAMVNRPLGTTVSYVPIKVAIDQLSKANVVVNSTEGKALVGIANSVAQMRQGYIDADWATFSAGVTSVESAHLGT